MFFIPPVYHVLGVKIHHVGDGSEQIGVRDAIGGAQVAHGVGVRALDPPLDLAEVSEGDVRPAAGLA